MTRLSYLVRGLDRAAGQTRDRVTPMIKNVARGLVVGGLSWWLALGGAQLVRGDVVGIGDIWPYIEIGPDDEKFVDLPIFGGAIPDENPPSDVSENADSPELIVGGTGQQVGGTDAGEMVVDIPNDTDPLFSEKGTIGKSANGLGQVSLLQPNTEWRLETLLTIGEQGQAFMEILNGARVDAGERDDDDEFASNSVPYEDSELQIVIGAEEESQGFLIVDGFASLMRSQSLIVGSRGYGSMTVSNRGRVDTREDAIIGEQYEITAFDNAVGTGLVELDGLGTRWNIGDTTDETPIVDANLIIGSAGRATMVIRNQAWARVKNDVLIGDDDDGYGQLTVNGLGSTLWALEELSVGDDPMATGIVNIENQGLVRADDMTTVGPRGLINLTGGTLLTPEVVNNGVIRGDGRIDIGVDGLLTNFGDIRVAAGLANVRERMWITGAVQNNENIEVLGGELEFEGMVTNDDEIVVIDGIVRFRGGAENNDRLYLDNAVVEGRVTNNGLIAVAASSASSIIEEVEFVAGSTFSVELGENFNPLEVIGTATLAGSVELELEDNFNVSPGDSWTILSAQELMGVFDMPPSSISGIMWSLSYTSRSVILNAEAGPVFNADFNMDGVVDGMDLARILANYGGRVPPLLPSDGDANGDGLIDGTDLILWQQQQGPVPAVAAGEAAAAAVPEPTALALALLGGTVMLSRRRR